MSCHTPKVPPVAMIRLRTSSIWVTGMTSSVKAFLVCIVIAHAVPTWAGLGDAEVSVNGDKVRMSAQHTVTAASQFSVHDLLTPEGGRFREYVSSSGFVFAVVWRAQYKPDLSTILGSSYPAYLQSAKLAAQERGIKRRFRLDGLDLVVHSMAHLNVFSGYAYRASMLPASFNLQDLSVQ